MKNKIVNTVWRSLVFYRVQSLYQFIVIMLLAAIITGSILTGSSVRKSLRENNIERIGNTSLVISSGVRYFPSSLAGRLEAISGTPVVAITELEGWSRNFSGGETALNCQVTAVENDFFGFHNPSSKITIKKGEAVINSKLAAKLNLQTGEEIMVRFGTISDIPADSPFSSEESSYESLVLVVRYILEEESPANFSLSVNQIKPENIFIHNDDLKSFFGGIAKCNRILIPLDPALSSMQTAKNLTEVLYPADIGLNLNEIKATAQYELISDRIFIDAELVNQVKGAIPEAQPLITYLANSINAGGRTTPYSFVSALPASLYDNVPDDEGININRWLAEDLGIGTGDSIWMTYYVSAPMNKLDEASRGFIVSEVVEIEGIWSDGDLMPRFPGISGKESCSRWDAGIPVSMDNIRQKDEDYWYSYRGTPKAFINYNLGRELWAGNFGPATAIRFPADMSSEDIIASLRGQIDPFKNGFTVTDARNNAIEAASNSVDFSTLFLSLGFFIIISSLLLLSLIVSTFFQSRIGHISTMRAIGFSSRLIRRILFLETAVTAITGSVAGIAAGYLFNRAVISALNSVWKGAVQTDTLTASFDPAGMATGLVATLTVTLLVLLYRSNRFLNDKSKQPLTGAVKLPGSLYLYPGLPAAGAIISIIAALVYPENATALFFAGGTLLLAASILLYLAILTWRGRLPGLTGRNQASHSWLFYGRNPSRAITPVIFIAAGLFIVIATGANRKSYDTNLLSRQSGTGGYLLWGETATPLSWDMNSKEGTEQYGLGGDELAGAMFIQAMVARGDDASCLNLNQVTTPPLLGIDAGRFARDGAFTFATRLKISGIENGWDALSISPGENTIYGVLDQTVLQWGLKLKVGDTITMATERGEPLHIIVAGGLDASVFQGYIVIDRKNFSTYLPSISGTSVFLVDGQPGRAAGYENALNGILEPYGPEIELTGDRLAEFNQVSNTYLTVFMTLGGFGMLLGITGLGFILLRNFNLRKREFALLLSTGYTPGRIRKIIFREHIIILFAGIVSGTIPAIIATLPSISSGAEIPFMLLFIMILSIFSAGFAAILLSSRSLNKDNLIAVLRGD